MKRIEKVKGFLNKNKFYVIIFAAVTFISIFFPPTSDDLGWATYHGVQIFMTGFKDYNGRYLGNICALVFTRLPYLLPILKGLTFSAILYLVEKISSNNSSVFKYSAAFLMLVPTSLFKEIFVWTAGFSNYCFPVLIIFICIYLILNNRDIIGIKGFFIALSVFILGIAGQLYMEPYTICALCLSFSATVFYSVKKRRLDIMSLVYFIACVVGAVIMFSNGAYLKILNGTSKYQSLTSTDTSSISRTILNGFNSLTGIVSGKFLLGCFPAVIVIVLLSIRLLLHNSAVSTKMRKMIITFFALAVVSIIMFPIYCYITENYNEAYIFIFIMMIMLVTACGLIIHYSLEKSQKTRVLFYFALIVFQCAILCFVSPVGTRCFCVVYLLMIMIIGEMQNAAYKLRADDEKLCKKRTGFFKIALIIILVLDLIGYAVVFSSNIKKVRTVRNEVDKGNMHIVLDRTTFSFLVHTPDIEGLRESCKKEFCDYYGFPYDIEIEYRD